MFHKIKRLFRLPGATFTYWHNFSLSIWTFIDIFLHSKKRTQFKWSNWSLKGKGILRVTVKKYTIKKNKTNQQLLCCTHPPECRLEVPLHPPKAIFALFPLTPSYAGLPRLSLQSSVPSRWKSDSLETLYSNRHWIRNHQFAILWINALNRHFQAWQSYSNFLTDTFTII